MAVSSSEVFRFVALRPVQLATEGETEVAVIRDRRADTEDGRKQITAFAHAISSPERARRRWPQVDLTPFAALAAGRLVLLEAYTRLDPNASAPPAAPMVTSAGLDGVDPADDAVWDRLWDSLYIAHATGPAAGPLLDGPTAALRALHFLALVAQTPAPERAVALQALSAAPAIDVHVDQALRPRSPRDPVAAPATAASAPVPEDAAAVVARRLTDEARVTSGLLGRLSAASPTTAPAVEAGPVGSFGRLHQQSLSLSTIRSAGSVLGDSLQASEAAVLDAAGVTTEMPLLEAQDRLEAYLGTVGGHAVALAGDAGFQRALDQLLPSGDLLSPFELPAPAPAPAAQAGDDPRSAPDVDVHGRIKPLGIGDLKVVKQTLLAYEPGEVAYIENVLGHESKSRVHRTLHRTQTTVFESTEQTSSTERDTQTTDRFELKRETNNTIKEDMSVKAGLQVTASYGPIVATATGDFAYSTSREDSQKASSAFAHDVVDRSITKVQVKTVSSRTTTTLDETEETNTHGFDNTDPAPVVGVYRWVDKRYRAQVYNYGSRLLLEFVVPEPAAFYRAARAGNPAAVDAVPPVPFLNSLTPFLRSTSWRRLAASDITASNYQQYAARYGASGVSPPPAATVFVSVAVQKDAMEDGKSVSLTSKDFVVPAGYSLSSHEVTASVLWVNYPKFTVQVADKLYNLVQNESSGNSHLISRPSVPAGGSGGGVLAPVNGPVAVSVAAYDVHAFAVNVSGVCSRDAATLVTWQLQTYDKIQTAYQALQTVYDQKLAEARQAARDATVRGQNPGLNRETERNELKKLCITMMTGQHFNSFNAVTHPSDAPAHHPEVDVLEALREGPVVQFFEQAFEWEQLTYLFYPYFWADKRRWVDTAGLSDPDPLFEKFLTAGSCRVVVPVPIPYVKAVLYLLQSPASDLASKVWQGGEPPTLDSPLYVSLAQEFRNQTDDLAGAEPEGDPWQFTLPTTLVWLQPDGTLPSF